MHINIYIYSPALKNIIYDTLSLNVYMCIHIYTHMCIYIYVYIHFCCYSVTKGISDSLQPHGLQHTRLPCTSLSHRVCLNSCPLNQLCHPTISSSVTHFFSCPQSFPASGSFPMSGFFVLGSQSIGAPAFQ